MPLHRLPCFRVRLFTLTVLLFFATLASHVLLAQSQSTASKRMDISVFGGVTNSDPDYGSPRNTGGTVGVDFSRHFRAHTTLSLEVRAFSDHGQVIDRKALLGGLQVQGGFGRFHPYFDALAGDVIINFNVRPSPSYTHDSTLGYGAGGGIDIDIAHHFQAKVDFLQQFENYGPNGTLAGNRDFTLSPMLFTVGVVYRIPFRPHNRQSDQ